MVSTGQGVPKSAAKKHRSARQAGLILHGEAVQPAKLHPKDILFQTLCVRPVRAEVLVEERAAVIELEDVGGPGGLEDLCVLVVGGGEAVGEGAERGLVGPAAVLDLLVEEGAAVVVVAAAALGALVAVALGLVVCAGGGDLFELLLQRADLLQVGLDLAVDDVDGRVVGLVVRTGLDVVQQAVRGGHGGLAQTAHLVVRRVQGVEVVGELAHARVEPVVVGRQGLQPGHAGLQRGGDVAQLSFDLVELGVVATVAPDAERRQLAHPGRHRGGGREAAGGKA